MSGQTESRVRPLSEVFQQPDRLGGAPAGTAASGVEVNTYSPG